jgi:transcriptional regulator with XRE-family HTH domain
MKTKKLPNYLRTYRRRAGLSQPDVAFLLGCKSKAKISRFELGTNLPTLKTALAYQAIFGVPVSELFAGVFEEIEREVTERAKLLQRTLPNTKGSKIEARRREFIRILTVAPDILAENS